MFSFGMRRRFGEGRLTLRSDGKAVRTVMGKNSRDTYGCCCCQKIRTACVVTGKRSVSPAQNDSHLGCLCHSLLWPIYSLEISSSPFPHLSISPLSDTSLGKSLPTNICFSSPFLRDSPAPLLSFLFLLCGYLYKTACLAPPLAQWLVHYQHLLMHNTSDFSPYITSLLPPHLGCRIWHCED